MATQKQKAAIDKIVENRGVVSRTMLEVGYKPKTAKNPKNLTESDAFKEAQPNIILRLTQERDAIIERLKKTRDKAKYRDLIDGMDKVTKNIQLLGGKETERTKVIFMPMELMKKHGINSSTKPDSE